MSLIGWGEAAVLGVVQGLTEFLPISSSAHLRISAELFGWEDPGAAFTAVTQLGTETAVLVYFAKDIARILKAWFRSLRDKQMRADPDARLGWLVLVGTLPIGVLGLLLQHPIESAFRSLWLIGATLIGFGLVLGYADKVARNAKPLEKLTLRDGILCGFAQALALVPGVSRSGGTISAALLLGYKREAAARFSFLLAIPAVLASGLFELKDIASGEAPVEWGPTILATVIAGLVGFAVIAWFLRYISKGSFRPFVVYRILLGLGVFALLAAGVIEAKP
nr:undecaprenyl-diphosphate phosphatase [Motilibacter deserti]